jgi:DNA-binding beta-propeller fold protein YncE
MKSILLPCLLLANLLEAFAQPPHLVQTIPLGEVQGRIDHMSMDVSGERLFVAALGNNTVEVVDLKQGKVVRSLSGFSEPQGVCFVPEFNLLAVANGGDGRCLFFDGTTLNPVGTLELGDDADNMRYDAARKKIMVGYGSGALAAIDPQSKQVTARITLGAHPESFQIDAEGSRVFVNVPNAHTINVVDLGQARVIGSYSLGQAAANFPMALDRTNHRLFVGCRLPSRLLVFDTRTGNKVVSLNLHGDCDDVFYDPARKQIYASCGEGFLDIFSQAGPDHYAATVSVATADGARTSFFNGDHFYLAVPHRGNQRAELRDYAF